MYLDIVVLIIILIGIIAGLKNGIFIEVISIFGFVLNLIIAKTYTPVVLNFFKRSDTFLGDNYFITYAVTFIAVYLIISIVITFIKKVLRSQNRGLFDRMLGAFIGAVKSLIVITIMFIVYINIIEFSPTLEKYATDSKAIGIMSEIIPNFEKYIPDYFLEKFNQINNKQIIEKNIDKIL